MAMIRPARELDFSTILELNRTWEHFLSPMGEARLIHLHAMAAYHRVIVHDEQLVAFLLAFSAGSDYDSSNYRWFAQRYERFLYIDRIVVAGDQQGQGLGKWLYQDLIHFAEQHAIPQITCEFDLDPPNENSRRFHEAFGFKPVGSQTDPKTGKQVSYQVLRLKKSEPL